MADKKREPNAFERLIQQPKPKGPPAPPRPKPATPRNAAGQPATKAEQESLRVLGTQGRAAQANQSAANRARAGDPRTLTQRALANPNSYESRVQQLRKQLNHAPDSEEGQLIASALYMRRMAVRRGENAMQEVSAQDVREVSRLMRTPEGRAQLKAERDQFRGQAQPQAPQAPDLPFTEQALREAQEMGWREVRTKAGGSISLGNALTRWAEAGMAPMQFKQDDLAANERLFERETGRPLVRGGMADPGFQARRANIDTLGKPGGRRSRESEAALSELGVAQLRDALDANAQAFGAAVNRALPFIPQEAGAMISEFLPFQSVPRAVEYGATALAPGNVPMLTRLGAAAGGLGSLFGSVGIAAGLQGSVTRMGIRAGADLAQVARTTEGAQAMVADMVRAGAQPIEAVQAVERVRRATPEELQGMVDQLVRPMPGYDETVQGAVPLARMQQEEAARRIVQPMQGYDETPGQAIDIAARQAEQANQAQNVPQISAKNLPEGSPTDTPSYRDLSDDEVIEAVKQVPIADRARHPAFAEYERRDLRNLGRRQALQDAEAERAAKAELNKGKSLAEMGRIARSQKALDNTKIRMENGDVVTLRERIDRDLSAGMIPEIRSTYKYLSKTWYKRERKLREAIQSISRRPGFYPSDDAEIARLKKELAAGNPKVEKYVMASPGQPGYSVITKAEYDYAVSRQAANAAPLAEAAPAPQAPQTPDLTPSRAIPEQAAGQKEPWQMTREEHSTLAMPEKEALINSGRSSTDLVYPKQPQSKVGSAAWVARSGEGSVSAEVFEDGVTLDFRSDARNYKAQIAQALVDQYISEKGISPIIRTTPVGDIYTKDFARWAGVPTNGNSLPIKATVGRKRTDAELSKTADNVINARHKSAVETALKEGKPVPPKVLADYPDLAAKYGNQPNAIQEPQATSSVLRESGTGQKAGQEAQVGLPEVRQGQTQEVAKQEPIFTSADVSAASKTNSLPRYFLFSKYGANRFTLHIAESTDGASYKLLKETDRSEADALLSQLRRGDLSAVPQREPAPSLFLADTQISDALNEYINRSRSVNISDALRAVRRKHIEVFGEAPRADYTDKAALLYQAIADSKATFIYGLDARPAGPGAIPPSPSRTFNDGGGFRHGYVAYTRRLTPEEIRRYELTPVRVEDADVGFSTEELRAGYSPQKSDVPIDVVYEIVFDMPREEVFARALEGGEDAVNYTATELRKYAEALPRSKQLVIKEDIKELTDRLHVIKKAQAAPVAPEPPKPATPKPPKPPAPKPPKAVVPPPEEPNLIGFRHQDIEPRLKEAGIDPIVIERLGDAGMRKAAAEEGYVARASDTARRIVESKKGSVDAKEVLGMQLRRLDIAVRQRALDKAIREAGDDITKLGQIDQELAALGREIVDIDQAIRLSTSEAGRTLREARFAIDTDTLDEVGIRNRWRGAAQGDLPANIEAQVKERAAAIAKAEEELADAQAALSKLEKENADLRAKIKMAEADSALKAKATPSRPRALQELETKATADFQSWKQKFAKSGVKGGKQRGSAIDPALLYEGAYLYSKMMLIKGVRKLDDIIRGAKEEGIELSREEMARAVERAADDLKPARKPKLEATMASLRKEIATAMGKDEAAELMRAARREIREAELAKAREASARRREGFRAMRRARAEARAARKQDVQEAIRQSRRDLFTQKLNDISARATGDLTPSQVDALRQEFADAANEFYGRTGQRAQQSRDSIQATADGVRSAIRDAKRQARTVNALKQVEELNAKLTRATTQEELDAIRDQLNKLSREIGPGKNFAEDGGALTVRRVNPETGKMEAMEIPQLAEQRAKVREARAKLDRERGKVKQVQELLRRKAEFNEKKGFEAAKAIIMEALGTLKALNLSADLGVFLRQGGIPLVTRPGGLGRSFKSLRKSFTEVGYDDVMAVIASNRFYDDAIDAGLKVGLDKEEDFLFNIFDIIDKKGDNKIVGGLNKYVKFNDRTYTAAIHQIRMDLFDELASGLEKSGTPMTKAEAKALAEFINDMTGASSLGSLDRHVPLLNNLLISARYYASRIKMLTSNVGAVLGTRPGLPPRVRLIMAKEYGRFLSFIGAIGLASHIYSHVAQKPLLQERDRLLRALRQAKGTRKREIQDRLAVVNDQIVAMQFDPRGSGAFTIKLGPARLDLTAGLRPFVNFFTRTGLTLAQSMAGIKGQDRMPNFVTSAGREVSDADYGSFSTIDQLIMSFFLMRSNPAPRILMADYAQGPLFDKPTAGLPMAEDAVRAFFPLAATIPIDTGLAKQGTAEERAGAAGLAFLINFLGLGSYEIPEKEKQASRDQKKLEKERDKKREELRNPGN